MDNVMNKISWSDMGIAGEDATPTLYERNQLQKDWDNDIGLIITVGHGAWFKHLLKDYLSESIPSEIVEEFKDPGDNSKYRQLLTTEFVLMKWQKTPEGVTDKAFEITQIMDFDQALRDRENDKSKKYRSRWGYLKSTARLGILNQFQYYDYGHYDDLYGYDEYAEDYYGDDVEESEHEIYEEAKDNLYRARKQFGIAQRLVGENPRRRWTGY